jgi:hypothetical protein
MVTHQRFVVPCGQTFAMSAIVSVACVMTTPAKDQAIRHIKIAAELPGA